MLTKGLRPPPDLTVSEWADANRSLSGKGSAEPGPFRTARTPYLQLPMDLMGVFSPAETVVLMFGAQLGKTEASMSVLGYTIDVAPGPILYVSPTVELAKRTSRQRIEPLIAESRVLRGLVDSARAREHSTPCSPRISPGEFWC